MVVVVNYQGKKLYVHGHGHNGRGYYFLKPNKKGALKNIPQGYEIYTNKRGLPYIKKKS